MYSFVDSAELEGVDDRFGYSSVGVIAGPAPSLPLHLPVLVMSVACLGQRGYMVHNPGLRRLPWLPWPQLVLISQASHSASPAAEHYIVVDSPYVVVLDDPAPAKLGSAVMGGWVMTDSYCAVDEEAGSSAR